MTPTMTIDDEQLTNGFDYLNLDEIETVDKPLDQDVYPLQLTRAAVRNFDKNGRKGQVLNLVFVVTSDHHSAAGRKIEVTFFTPLKTWQKQYLRRLADATGIQQGNGRPFEAWVAELAAEKPQVKQFIFLKQATKNIREVTVNDNGEEIVSWRREPQFNPDETPLMINELQFKEVRPF